MNLLMAEHTYFEADCRVGCHHLAESFVKNGYRVTYLSSVLSPLHLAHLLGKKREETWVRFASLIKGGNSPLPSLLTNVPFSFFPYLRLPLLDRVQTAAQQLNWMVPNIKRLIQRRGNFEGCLIGDPRWIPLIDLVPGVPSLLRLTDDPSSFSSMPRTVKGLIGSALKKEIPIVVTSKGLLDFLQQNYHFSNAHYLPNGVVQEDFFPLATEEPADLRKIPHPRILYVGKIDDRIDKSWVEEAAQRLPEVAFIFIGPVINKLPKRPNLFCLGSRPYSSLRGYFSFVHAAMIPFQKTPRTDAMSSIKLLQYLAAGLPVVVPKLREIEEQRAPVLFADSPSSFVEKLKEAIFLGRRDYRAFLKPYSWESNREYLETLLRG